MGLETMDWSLIFIIGSLVFALAFIVGANIWALRDGPVRGLEPSLEPLVKEIDEYVDVEARNTGGESRQRP
jgi:hypothetical protein